MSKQSNNQSFCRRVVCLGQTHEAKASFLPDIEAAIIAARPTRPGRKELRDRDKPLRVKDDKFKKKQENKISTKKDQAKQAKAPAAKPDAPQSDTKKEGNIDQFGRFSLKDLEDEEKAKNQDSGKNTSEEVVPTEENKEIQDDDFNPDDDRKSSSRELTAIRSMEDPYIFLINFRNSDEKKPFFRKLEPILNPASVVQLFGGKSNDKELSQFFAFVVAGNKRGDFSNILGKIAHEAQALPEGFLNQDAPFDEMMFGPDFKKLQVNETKVKRALNEVIRRISSSPNQAGQVSALRMMSEIPIDYIRFLNPLLGQREFYIGGNPPNAGTKGTRLALCEEDEAKRFMKVMEFFKPVNPFFNDLYFVNDIDPDFKDYAPFKIIPARAIILEAKTKFEMDKEVEVADGKVELLDGKTGKPIQPTQFEFLKKYVEENMGNIAKQGTWKKARYYEGDNWIHLNRDHTKAILWGSRTKALSLSKNDILNSLPFVKNVNLTFIK